MSGIRKYGVLTAESWAVVFGTMKQELLARYPGMWVDAAWRGLKGTIDVSFVPYRGKEERVRIPPFSISAETGTPASAMRLFHRALDSAEEM